MIFTIQHSLWIIKVLICFHAQDCEQSKLSIKFKVNSWNFWTCLTKDHQYRKQNEPAVLCEIAFLENFAKFTGKHKQHSRVPFFKRVALLQLRVELFRKRVPCSKFSNEVFENIWKTYFTEHLKLLFLSGSVFKESS